jgi:hypothetical protein
MRTLIMSAVRGEVDIPDPRSSVRYWAILLHGTGKREADRTWSAVISLETGNVTAGVSTSIRRFPCKAQAH